MSNLKHIDFSKSVLPANGKEYLIEKGMSGKRYTIFEELQSKIGWGVDFDTMLAKVKMAFEYLNKSKPADAAVILYNMIEMISEKLQKRMLPTLQLCTLFINTKDEDRRTWSEALAEEKINDWNEEGYDINDFFVLALNMVPGLVIYLNETSQTISEQKTTKEKGKKS